MRSEAVAAAAAVAAVTGARCRSFVAAAILRARRESGGYIY